MPCRGSVDTLGQDPIGHGEADPLGRQIELAIVLVQHPLNQRCRDREQTGAVGEKCLGDRSRIH